MLCMFSCLIEGEGANEVGRNCRFSRGERRCFGRGYGGLTMYAIRLCTLILANEGVDP